MKTRIKLGLILVFSSLLIFGYTSCSNDDGYSLGDFWVDWATVKENDGGSISSFVLDDKDSTTLFVAATATGYQPKNKRVIINYTILSDNYNGYDHAIKLNGYYADVLTKQVLYVDTEDKVKQDSIGNDPIEIYSIWEAGGYLNFHFGYNTGEQNSHFISLISGEPDLSVGSDVVNLEFRHNQNSDPQNYLVKGCASFDLLPYRIAGRETVKFNIKVKISSSETKNYEIQYKYGNAIPKK